MLVDHQYRQKVMLAGDEPDHCCYRGADADDTSRDREAD
jgi:hypothetical protein